MRKQLNIGFIFTGSKRVRKWFSDSYIFWIAFRNLLTRSGLGLSFMTIVSIAGVAVGVSTLIIVLSVMGGFEDSLTKKMLRGEPHLELFAKNAQAGFSLNQLSVDQVKKLVPEATEVQPFTKADVVLKHRKNLQSAELIGVAPQADAKLWIFTSTLVEGQVDSLEKDHEPYVTEDRVEGRYPGIILGEGLANNLGVSLGDEILVINPMLASDPNELIGGETSVRRYVLTGIFRALDIKYDNKWAVVNLHEGRRFMSDYDESLEEEKYVSAIALDLKDPFSVAKIKKRFARFDWLNPLSWDESNKSLLFALKLEKFAMGSILMLIVVVAAFSISGTMMMTVFHRKMQVSLLRALGMTRKGVSKLFLAHGCAIGLVGTLLGLIVGLGVCFLIQKLQIIDLPKGVYYQNKLPVRFLPNTYVVICTCAWAFSLLASAYPAMTAARQNPSDGLRYE